MRALRWIGICAIVAVVVWFALADKPDSGEGEEDIAVTHESERSTAPATPALHDGSKPLPGTQSSISANPVPLILVGTEPGRNVHDGKAYIGTSRENPQTYRAGALLVNGARVAEIHAGLVVVERQGERFTMYVDGTRTHGAAVIDVFTAGGLPTPKSAEPTFHNVLSSYIRPSPLYEAHLLKGYQVYAGPRSGIFMQMGLQNGDVILALDGVPLSDPQQAMSLFGRLTDGATLVATVDRRGSRTQVTLVGALIVKSEESAGNALTPSPSVPGMVTSQ